MSRLSLPNIRIGQITDLHARGSMPGSAAVVQRRSREGFDLLARAIGALKERGAQFLAITGDLLDVPGYVIRRDDYYDYGHDRWIADAEADYRAIKRLLDGCGLPYAVLPGNHDDEPAMWRVFDRAANVIDLPSGYRVVRFCDREHDLHVPRRLDRERVLWETMLADPDSPPQIHLQHYVVTPALNEGYPHSYFEGEHLARKTAASGAVALCLSGHYHAGTDAIRDGNCLFATGPAVSEFPHAVRLYELGAGGASMQTIRLCDKPIGHGRPVVFLDRDGVINTLAGYRTGPEAMELIPGSALAIRQLREAGFAVVVITSQSCVGMGYVTRGTVDAVHDRMSRLLGEAAGPLAEPDAVFFSTGAGAGACAPCHETDETAKPSPALLHRAQALLGLTFEHGWMIGDRDTDLQTALAAGVKPALVRTGAGRQTEASLVAPVPVFDDLADAARHILWSRR